MVSWKSFIIVGMSTSLIQGCAFRAASTGMAIDQNQFAADATNQQTLFNILRAKDRLPTHFTSLGQISGSIEANVSARATLPHLDRTQQNVVTNGVSNGNPLNTTAITSTIPRLDATFEAAPSLKSNSNYQLAVNATETFYRGILAPIKPSTVETFLESGYSRGLLTHLFVGDVRFSVEVKASDQNDPAVLARCETSLAKRLEVNRADQLQTDASAAAVRAKQLTSLCKDGATARFQTLRNQGDILSRQSTDALQNREGLALDALFRCRQLAQGRSQKRTSSLPVARLGDLQGVSADVLKNVKAVTAKPAANPGNVGAGADKGADAAKVDPHSPYAYELVETSALPTLDYADPPVVDAKTVDDACVFARRYLVTSFETFRKRLADGTPVSQAVSDLAFSRSDTAAMLREVLLTMEQPNTDNVLKLASPPVQNSDVQHEKTSVPVLEHNSDDKNNEKIDCLGTAFLTPEKSQKSLPSGRLATNYRDNGGQPGTALELPEFFETLVIQKSIDGVDVNLVIDISFRSTEAIIHYLGEYARPGKKLCLANDKGKEKPIPVFALLKDAADLIDGNKLLLRMRYRGQKYGVGLYDSDEKQLALRARTSTSLSIVQQLLNLNRNAQDLPTVQNVRIAN
jgi:hypothetical protein